MNDQSSLTHYYTFSRQVELINKDTPTTPFIKFRCWCKINELQLKEKIKRTLNKFIYSRM